MVVSLSTECCLAVVCNDGDMLRTLLRKTSTAPHLLPVDRSELLRTPLNSNGWVAFMIRNLSWMYNEMTLVHLAAHTNSFDAMRVLIECGARVSLFAGIPNPGSYTPLTLAVRSEGLQTVKVLLDAFTTDAIPFISYALKEAVRILNCDVIELLLQYGAYPLSGFVVFDVMHPVDTVATTRCVELLLSHFTRRAPERAVWELLIATLPRSRMAQLQVILLHHKLVSTTDDRTAIMAQVHRQYGHETRELPQWLRAYGDGSAWEMAMSADFEPCVTELMGAVVQTLLKRGQIDPDKAARSTPAPAGAGNELRTIACQALQGWTRQTHALYPAEVRHTVCNVMLAARRAAARSSAACMPLELWTEVLRWCKR